MTARILEVVNFLKPGEVWSIAKNPHVNVTERVVVRQLSDTFRVTVSCLKRRGDGYYDVSRSKRWSHEHMNYARGFEDMFEDEYLDMVEEVRRD